MWAKGDYREIARRLVPTAKAVVDVAGVRPNDRVLDLAAGDGNVAMAAAAAGAAVTALELEPVLVAWGRERTAGLDIDWVIGDVLELPFPDRSFDAVLSAFGLMYAPDPSRAAAEAFRVARAGGVVALAAWTRDGFHGQSFDAISALLPSRPDQHRPELWGDERWVSELLAPHTASLRLEQLILRGPVISGPEEWWNEAERYAPPLVALRDAVPADVFARAREALIELAGRFALPVEGGIVIEQAYLIAIGHAP